MFDKSKAKRAIALLTPDLEALDKKLTGIEKIKDPVDRLVAFSTPSPRGPTRSRMEEDLLAGLSASPKKPALSPMN